jgi:hypothetical protein
LELLQESMVEYKKQLEKGAIQHAYRGLMDYFWSLKLLFETKCPDYPSGGIYYGFMDMTYFALFPKSLKQRKLKIAIVFLHEKFRFKVWLAGTNKGVQAKYWNLIKESVWTKYHLPERINGADSIVESILVENPDFSNLEFLTKQIETKTLEFTKDVENFLLEHEDLISGRFGLNLSKN